MAEKRLNFKPLKGEMFRDTVIRYAKPHGLEAECLEIFDNQVKNGTPPDSAAFNALYEWDVLDYS